MKKFLVVCAIFLGLLSGVQAQPVFDDPQLLYVHLIGNIRELMNDRAETPSPHPFSVEYSTDQKNFTHFSAQLKTRGHFRKDKENCQYPPLLITFPNKEVLANSIFAAQTTYKLVMPCRDQAYVVREWLVYQLYNLISPMSFKARLVRVELIDPAKKIDPTLLYGILLENENSLAARNKASVVKTDHLQPQDLQTESFTRMAVFQYLIGNTDWSVQYRQNIKLLGSDSSRHPVAVPYDFDHAGIVGASYAYPAPELNLSSIYRRRYRGYCTGDMSHFNDAINLFNRIKAQIYSLYTSCPLLEEKYKTQTVKYLDGFYETINNPQSLKKEFGYPCDPNGTGHVVIKGLRETGEKEDN